MLAGLLNGGRVTRLGELIYDNPRVPTTVWRIQNAEGRGIYADGIVLHMYNGVDDYLTARYGEEAAFDFRNDGGDPPPPLEGPDVPPQNLELEQIAVELQQYRYMDEDKIPSIDFDPDEWERVPHLARKVMRFAFRYPEDAEKWFGPAALSYFAAKGYRLVPVKALKVYLSSTGQQVVYLPPEEPESRDLWESPLPVSHGRYR